MNVSAASVSSHSVQAGSVDRGRPGSVPFWAEPRWFFSILIAYLAIHFATRMAMWPTLGIDDAEQALFSQQFEWSYRYRAPPSFTWVLLALSHVIDPGILGISLIRYVLLGTIYVFVWLSAHLVLGDRRLAALVAYGLSAVYVLGFYSHHDLTHTTAMTAALAGAWYVGLRLLNQARHGWFVLFGIAAGLGLISKWNFAVFLAALALAALTLVPLRRRLLWNPGVLLATLALAIVAGPTFISTTYHGPEGGDSVAHVLGTGSGDFLLDRLAAAGRLTLSALVYPQPFLLIALVAFWKFYSHERATRLWAWREAEPQPAAVAMLITLVALALLYVLALGTGAANLNERLLQPALFMAPVLALVPADGAAMSNRSLNQFAGIMLAVALVAFGGRWGVYWNESRSCKFCRAHLPIAELANNIRASGYDGHGTIVVDHHHLGGNLRVEFPSSRVADVRFPLRYWSEPRGADGDCLFVVAAMPAEDAGALFAPHERFAQTQLSARLGAPDVDRRVSLHILGSGSQTREYAFRLYKRAPNAENGTCR